MRKVGYVLSHPFCVFKLKLSVFFFLIKTSCRLRQKIKIDAGTAERQWINQGMLDISVFAHLFISYDLLLYGSMPY